MFSITAGLDIEKSIAKLKSLEDFDVLEAAEQSGAVALDSSHRRIDRTKLSPEGKPWPPHSPRYAPRAKRKGGTLLKLNGVLMRSLELDRPRRTATGAEVELSSSLPYAGVHQRGFKGKDKLGRNQNIPKRAYLGLAPEDRGAIAAVLVGELRRAAR